MILSLQSVTTFDVSRFIRGCDNTLTTNQACMFVDHKVLSMNTFSDNHVCTDDTILNNCPFFDCTATSNIRILNSTFNQASVRNYGGCYLAAFKILCRAGVICTCINWPVIMEQICCFFQVDQLKVCFIVTIEV